MASTATARAWQAAVSNEDRTALVTELYNELVRRESDPTAADTRVRVWVAAANTELTLWRSSPDKESYVAGVRLKAAQLGAEMGAYSAEPWANMGFTAAEPVSSIDHLSGAPYHEPVPDQSGARSTPLTLKEQTHIAQLLALLDAQNVEIVALYQRHFSEIQRLVDAQAATCATPQERELQKQSLQREQESARLQLQQLHELQQQQLRDRPAGGRWGPLVRSPSVDAHESMQSMVTVGVAASAEATDGPDPSDLLLPPLSLTHKDVLIDAFYPQSGAPGADSWVNLLGNAEGTDEDLLARMTLLPYSPPRSCEPGDLGLSPVSQAYDAPSSTAACSSKQSMLSPGGHTGDRHAGEPPPPPQPVQQQLLLVVPAVVDLTAAPDRLGDPNGSGGARCSAVNEALRLVYTSRVAELRLEYQSDLVALYRELRLMRKSPREDAARRKIDALMVDIKKILVVLTRAVGSLQVVDEHIEELEHVETYIQRRVRPMSQRLKVKQAIFGDQRGVPATAARTAQRQWQRFLRRMRDQQQLSPSSALPVNVSPPRRLGV